MSVSHHLDDATLMRYAAGDLDEAFTLIVAAHIAMCETCRIAAHNAEAFGGHLLEKTPTASINDNAFDQLMANIDAASANDQNIALAQNVHKLSPRKSYKSDVPVPLQRLIGERMDAVKWKKVAPGIAKYDIDLGKDAASSLFMLNLAPGQAVPEHGHGGMEMTLVLSGAYTDRFGRFGPGDIADLDEHVEHQPIVEQNAPCICIVATEKPTKFKGFIERLLQPVIGI